jgi:hypothetical protein
MKIAGMNPLMSRAQQVSLSAMIPQYPNWLIEPETVHGERNRPD